MELYCIGKYWELSVTRGPSENVGLSENGACLHRKVQAAAGGAGGEAGGRQKIV